MFRHHLFSSIDFNHHQSATSEEFSLGDASSPKAQIDDVMSPIRDEFFSSSVSTQQWA